MSQSTSTSSASASYRQVAMILVAMIAGTVVTRVVPEVRPMAGYVQHTRVIPSGEVFKHADARKASHDSSRDLTGIDVDFRRLALLGSIS